MKVSKLSWAMKRGRWVGLTNGVGKILTLCGIRTSMFVCLRIDEVLELKVLDHCVSQLVIFSQRWYHPDLHNQCQYPCPLRYHPSIDPYRRR